MTEKVTATLVLQDGNQEVFNYEEIDPNTVSSLLIQLKSVKTKLNDCLTAIINNDQGVGLIADQDDFEDDDSDDNENAAEQKSEKRVQKSSDTPSTKKTKR